MRSRTKALFGLAVGGVAVIVAAARNAPDPAPSNPEEADYQRRFAKQIEFNDLAGLINIGKASVRDQERYDHLSRDLYGRPAFDPVIE